MDDKKDKDDKKFVDSQRRVRIEEASPFVSDQNETVIKVEDFKGFLDHFRKKIGRHKPSLLFQSNLPGGELFSKADWSQFDEIRQKYKHNRTIITDGVYILVKEMPSPMHARIGSILQSILSRSICNQLLPQDGREEYDKVVPSCNGRLNLGRFMGEPDGGLAWYREVVPFIVLEIGYSDSSKKTCNRAQHWITQGQGRITLAIALKVEVTNTILTGAKLVLYRWSMTNPNSLVTRNTVHGCCIEVSSMDLMSHNTRILHVPTDAVFISNNCPNMINNVPQQFNVDVSQLFALMKNLVTIGAL